MIRRLVTTLGASIVAVTLATGAAEACPDWQLEPPFGAVTLDAGFLPDPYSRNVTAGGGFNLLACGFTWEGYVAAAPDFDLYYNAEGFSLTFYVQSSSDTILLISDPSGAWHFNDDGGGGLNPSITINKPQSGLYDVWIGTYSPGSGLRARLFITEF